MFARHFCGYSEGRFLPEFHYDCRRMAVIPLRLVIAILALAALGGMRAAAAADSLPIEILKAEVGYGGVHKSGFWTPIWLTIRAPRQASGILEVLAPDGDRVPVAYAAGPPLQLAAGEHTPVQILVKVGPQDSTLTARFRDAETGGVLWEAPLSHLLPRPLPATAELVVSLGEFPPAAESAKLIRRGPDHRLVHGAVAAASRAPNAWWGWEGVETIVLPLRDVTVLKQLTPAQWQALRQWVEVGGGRLVICAADESVDEAALAAVAELLPGNRMPVRPVRDLSQLEAIGGAPLNSAPGSPRPSFAPLEVTAGQVETSLTDLGQSLPILVRSSRGMGEVVYLGINPMEAGWAGWPGSTRLLASAIAGQSGLTAASDAPRRSTARLGYDDLVGQLRTALDRFPGVHVVNITSVSVLTLAYLGLIGPISYLLLRRLSWQPIVTWGSFLLLVVAFCWVASYATSAAHGRAAHVNQTEIIDIDPQAGMVRGTAWMHVYSPQTRTYDVAANVQGQPLRLAQPPSGTLSWQGLPGDGLGGLAANQLMASSFSPYEADAAGEKMELRDLPVSVAGSKSLSARWWGRCDVAPPPPLTRNQYDALEGEVLNPLPVALADCLLVHDEWMYRLGTLGSGERLRMSQFNSLNLEARLQRRTVAGAKDVLSPWDRQSAEVPRIVQMLMFHEAAGGRKYTNLMHRYQSYVDLTPRIRSSRAILVGHIAQHVTELSLDGQPLTPSRPAASEGDAETPSEPRTFVRILIPVVRGTP
jgi:hypothetical protein